MYSQHQEDEFIVNYCSKSKLELPRLIVDVGAGDGLFLSNSRMLIQMFGFDAILIEPSKEPFFQCQDLYKTYPPKGHVECLNIALSDEEYGYSIEQKGHWTVNHIIKKDGAKEKTELLSKLLTERNIANVGILSIDTEGMDTAILSELIKNSRVRPTFVLVEGPDNEFAKQYEILKKDYIYLNTFSFNNLFLNKQAVP